MSAGVEREAISEAERGAAMRTLRRARSALKTFRATAKNPDAAVRYTAGQHRAIEAAFALQEYMIGRLADRIEKLEARPSAQYRGIWQAAENYEVNDQCTHRGALWIAQVQSKGLRPGDGGLAWKMQVKSGKAI